MAATNYTPIQLYHSTTTTAVPVNTNLVDGELAINITDGKLFYKDNSGTVQVIATKATGTIGGSTTQVQYNNAGVLAGSANFTFNGTTATINTLNLTNALGAAYGGTAQSSYTQGDIIYATGTTTLAKLGIGLSTYILTSTGSAPQWTVPTSVSVNTATNLAGGAAGSVPYQSGAGATTFLSIGTANQVLTSSGTAPQWSSGLSITTLTASDAVTFSATTQNIALGTSQTSGIFTVGGAAQTGNITLDQSTKAHTLNIGSGATENATTKTINIGTGGVSGSTTTMTIGSTNGTTITLNGTVTAATFNSTTIDTTNLEVTNIKAKDGTASITLADSTGVASFTANPILSGGTANGVVYLNASKVATTGSALTFDGTQLGINVAAPYGGIYATIHAFAAGGSSLRLDRTGAGTSTIQSVETGVSYRDLTLDAANNIFSISGSEKMRLAGATGGVGALGIGYTSLTSVGDSGLAVLGNVGIGTSSPAGKLSSVVTAAGAASLTLERTGSSRFEFQQGIIAVTGDALRIIDTTLSRDYLMLRDGNVGIGTTAPAYKLEVNGGASDAMSLFNSTNANGAHLRFAASGTVKSYIGGAPGFLGSGTADDLGIRAVGSVLFATNGSSVDMTLDASGNLGLGVTPSAFGSAYKAFQFGTTGALYGESGDAAVYLACNAFITSTGANTYITSDFATRYNQENGVHKWMIAASGTANTTTITNGVSYTIITSGNQTAFGAANNNVGTAFTATSSGTLSSGTVSQNISFTQAMTLDASGNLGVGTTTPSAGIGYSADQKLLGIAGSGAASTASIGVLVLQNNRATPTSSDSLGSVGFASASNTGPLKAEIYGFLSGSGGGTGGFGGNIGFATRSDNSASVTERARITSGGYFKASNDGNYVGSTNAYHEFKQTANNFGLLVKNTNASVTEDVLSVQADRNTNNNSYYFIRAAVTGVAYTFQVADSGNVTNTNGSYGTISDQKMKTDIVDAGSQWSDIKALRFRKFKMKDDPSGLVQLGVVAQEVELTSPGLVDEHQDRDAEGNDLGTTTKSVKTSVLLMKAAVALQEAMARIETLEAEVAALKGA